MIHTHNELAEQSNYPTEEIKDWEYPIPFTTIQIEDIPYPTQALPSILQNTVTEYQQYGQQPTALIACSALANISLACQSLANVARDDYLLSPISLYFCMAAFSGERKPMVNRLIKIDNMNLMPIIKNIIRNMIPVC